MLARLLRSILRRPARGEPAPAINVDAPCDRAFDLWDGGDVAGAERLLRGLLQQAPGAARATSTLGALLLAQGRVDEGLALCRRAVELDPDSASAQVHLGIGLYSTGATEQAIGAYRAALRLDPDHVEARRNLLMPLLETCDWDGVDGELARLRARLAADPEDPQALGDVDPFLSLLLPLAPAQRLRIARHHAARAAARVAALAPLERRAPANAGARLRIGYVSNGFGNAATAHLATGLFEQHDKSRFETFAYSLSADDGSDYQRRNRAAFDHYVDLRPMSHREAAQRIADDGVQILVDLMGYQAGARPELVELRPAPVQIGFLGYPGTLGTAALDYLIVDRVVAPAADAAHYAEQLIWLPDTYQVNDRAQRVAAPTTRARHGLPEDAWIWCAFNQHSKIERPVFEAWLRLLVAVPASVLWLSAGPGRRRLQAAAAQAGIDPARLVFAPPRPKAEHLARLQLADLFLDTLTYNAHTTASDALWAGVPVLTRPTDAFAGRVAASLLQAVGLPELVCSDLAQYETLARTLATDRPRHEALRERLRARRLTSPLFDTGRFTRHLEQAYLHAWQRHASGAPPAAFAVEAEAPDTA